MNDKRTPEERLSNMPIEEALERFANTDPREMPSRSIVPHTHNGQVIPQRATDGYINATAMCKALGKEWASYRRSAEPFLEALERSLQIRRDRLVLTVSGGPNDQRGTWVHPQIAINLATWLSPDFAVQVSEWVVTWMMGIAQKKVSHPDFNSLTEVEKRMYLRDQVTASNKKLEEAAHSSGVITPQDFSIFQSYGYRGMYDGRAVKDIRKVKGLPQNAQILDHMGSAELAANLFHITQTEEKLINEKTSNKHAANTAHFAVESMVRKAMIEISGTPPERLPIAPDVKKLQRASAKDQIENLRPMLDITPTIEPTTVASEKPINLRKDLWKYALLIMATKKDGKILTSDLIAELPNYIRVPDGSQEVLSSRKDSKFSQIVRNLKSHKTAKTNFIYQGFAEAIPDGFRITERGREFVKDYFSR